MALAWKAGWVQALAGSNPASSALVGGGLCQAIAEGVVDSPVVYGPVEVVEPLP